MKTAYLIPGTGETFYCENCHRDLPLIDQMRKLGHEVLAVPLYLPLLKENSDPGGDTAIFFGAVDMFLAQNLPFYGKLPLPVRKIFDNPSLLKFVSRFTGSTSPGGLERMTLNMLDPDYQKIEEDALRLSTLLKESDIELIHISNALLLGLGVYLKRTLGLPLVCTLQDEDTWLDNMASPYREEAWNRIRVLAGETDLFLPVSNYYGEVFEEKSSVVSMRKQVISIGVGIGNYPFFPAEEKGGNDLTLAYLSHQKEGLGLDILVSAYKRLREISRFSRLRLLISGGSTRVDRAFVRDIKKSLKREHAMGDVVYYTSFQLPQRIELLKNADVLSVPMEEGEAFGTYLIEAMACGVPVVQPDCGAFPEIINKTGGGLLYNCHDRTSLYARLKQLLEDRQLRTKLSEAGRAGVEKHYSQQTMAALTGKAYEKLVKQ